MAENRKVWPILCAGRVTLMSLHDWPEIFDVWHLYGWRIRTSWTESWVIFDHVVADDAGRWILHPNTLPIPASPVHCFRFILEAITDETVSEQMATKNVFVDEIVLKNEAELLDPCPPFVTVTSSSTVIPANSTDRGDSYTGNFIEGTNLTSGDQNKIQEDDEKLEPWIIGVSVLVSVLVLAAVVTVGICMRKRRKANRKGARRMTVLGNRGHNLYSPGAGVDALGPSLFAGFSEYMTLLEVDPETLEMGRDVWINYSTILLILSDWLSIRILDHGCNCCWISLLHLYWPRWHCPWEGWIRCCL